jgi:RHS repeat-associated protein
MSKAYPAVGLRGEAHRTVRQQRRRPPTSSQDPLGDATLYGYDAHLNASMVTDRRTTGTGLTGLAYTYDPVGNRLTQVRYGTGAGTTTSKYNADDQLCWTKNGTSTNGCATPPTGSTVYTFSANGDETNAGSTTYGYDLENRMTAATVASVQTGYTYDGDGNRLSATTAGVATTYLWDTNASLPQLATERNGSGSTLRDYSYGAGLNSMTASGANYYYLFDAYAGVANLTSSSGATEWTYAADPFGASTATKNDPNAPANPMQFDRQYLDPATGLYNLRARVHDPALGRFLQVDPVPSPVAQPYTASYVYVGDRPTVMADPSGTSWQWLNTLGSGVVHLPSTLKEVALHPGSSYEAGTVVTPAWLQQAGWGMIAIGAAGLSGGLGAEACPLAEEGGGFWSILRSIDWADETGGGRLPEWLKGIFEITQAGNPDPINFSSGAGASSLLRIGLAIASIMALLAATITIGQTPHGPPEPLEPPYGPR